MYNIYPTIPSSTINTARIDISMSFITNRDKKLYEALCEDVEYLLRWLENGYGSILNIAACNEIRSIILQREKARMLHYINVSDIS
jgi:hypothetical protein